MPVTTEQMYVVFQSIDASLKLLVAHFGCTAKPQAAPASTARPVPRIAPDADLDGTYGDPIVRAKAPRDWSGDEQLGKPFSECPADYLELVAARLEYFTSTEPDEKKRRYQELDASRARGWAARKRAGWKPPATGAGFPSDAVADEDMSF